MPLSPEQCDTLAELINIGVGRAAAALADLVGERIALSVPRVDVCELDELDARLDADGHCFETLVYQDFDGGLYGRAVLAFPTHSGRKFAQLLGHLNDLPDELDVDLHGILVEVGNIVLGSVLGTVSNLSGRRLTCHVPELSSHSPLSTVMATRATPRRVVFIADVDFLVDRRDIRGSIVCLFESNGIRAVIDTIALPTVAPDP